MCIRDSCEYGVDSRARDSLVAMVNDANAAGCGLWYSSIYRSVDSQRQNFESRVQMSMSQAGGDLSLIHILAHPS